MYVCFQCHARYPVYTGWCGACLESGTLMLEPQRSPSVVSGAMQTASARELLGRKWSMIESVAYPELRLTRGALVAVYGGPGAGKSTWATRWADGLPGAVVYFSAEERLGPTVGERLERCGVTGADFHVVGQASVDELVGLCVQVGAVALVVDSVQATSFRPVDLRPLMEAARVSALAFTQQVTKAGEAAGSHGYLHEADVVVRVAAGSWSLDKSRYQGLEGTPVSVG